MNKTQETKHRREAFVRAVRNLSFRQPMSYQDYEVIEEIAFDVLSGHDARHLLGVKPTRGPRSRHEGYELDIAIYFLALRKTKVLAKVAAARVASEYAQISRRLDFENISASRVMKIARKHRDLVEQLFKSEQEQAFDYVLSSRKKAKWWTEQELGEDKAHGSRRRITRLKFRGITPEGAK